jgi:hypothetical protein
MKTVIKKVFICLMFVTVTHILVAQEWTEDLSFKSWLWNYSYYEGSKEISFKDFMSKLKTSSDVQVPRMFKSGKNLSVTGNVIGSIGSFCFGYDLGSRLAGAKGNTAMLVGGGSAMVAGIVMSYIGVNKMNKALTLYQSASVSFSISPAQTGIGLYVSF